MLKDYRLSPVDGSKPKHAVIFLHGLGDRGDGGLLSIGEIWQRDLRDCVFLCPDAPFPFDMAPPEFGDPRAVAWSAERAETKQRQWFSLQSFTPEEMVKGAQKAAPFLNDYIAHILQSYDLTPDHLALVGFSQGTMMALYVGPRWPHPPACIIGYSGVLLGAENLGDEKQSSPPTLLVHGKMDEVVPFAAMETAERSLKKAGIPITTITCPTLGHSIDDVGIIEGLRFLKKAWS